MTNLFVLQVDDKFPLVLQLGVHHLQRIMGLGPLCSRLLAIFHLLLQLEHLCDDKEIYDDLPGKHRAKTQESRRGL